VLITAPASREVAIAKRTRERTTARRPRRQSEYSGAAVIRFGIVIASASPDRPQANSGFIAQSWSFVTTVLAAARRFSQDWRHRLHCSSRAPRSPLVYFPRIKSQLLPESDLLHTGANVIGDPASNPSASFDPDRRDQDRAIVRDTDWRRTQTMQCWCARSSTRDVASAFASRPKASRPRASLPAP
jgi:hypothetical protein